MDVLMCWADKRYSPTRTATELSMSESKVGKLRRRIRKQYDIVQKEHPEVLPPRNV